MELFKDNQRTYATRANAIKAAEKAGIEDKHWIVATNEQGRFYPVVFLDSDDNHHYYIAKGCCVWMK